MKIDVTRNATRSFAFSAARRLYSALIAFVMRTVMIRMLSIEYAGLNGLFTSLLNVLSLAELGIGTAIVYSMYMPIAQDDPDKICALLQSYKKWYRGIGFVILGLGVLCLPFLDRLITGNVPQEINIHLLFFMHLINTVSSYCLFSYRSALLSAHQRSDVISRIQIWVTTGKCLCQIIVLFLTRNYYLYLAVSLCSTLINNLLIYRKTERMYPEYRAKGKLANEEKKQIFTQVKALFLSRIGGIAVNSADTLIISAVLGVTTLGMYQNYSFILTSVSGIVMMLPTACRAGIGNMLANGDRHRVYESFEHLSFWLVMVCGVCCSCFLGLFQPFICVWIGEEMLLGFGAVVLFCACFFARQMMGLCDVFEDAGGVWHYDRYRPALEALLNLTLNFLLVHRFGIYGVITATIVSMLFFSLPWHLHNLFKRIFRQSKKTYLFKMADCICWIVLICVLSNAVCCLLPEYGIGALAVRTIVCVAVPCCMIVLRYGRSEEAEWLLHIASKVRNRRSAGQE